METLVCPKGHQSSDLDYCSECGAKIGNGIGNGVASAVAPAADADVCPDCATARDHKGVAFCEICGYNFLTGARGEIPVNFYAAPAVEAPEVMPAAVADSVPEPVEPEPAASTAAWGVVVSVDQASKQSDSPDPPADFVPFTVALDKLVSLIGRTSQTRAIFPEIAMDHDDAVSHRHALLQFDAEGSLVVRDIGAANGTIVNGKEIKAMVDYPLQDGDEITLGHWSRITIKATV
jgi:hypothetical protein